MSQSWNAHWVEDGFRSKRLGNWEVPKWYAQWPDMHCTTTQFEAHKNGRLFTSIKRSKNPWSNFKGTWELPLKIDRKTAEKLSTEGTEFKKAFWDAHEAKNLEICQRDCKGKCNHKNRKINNNEVKINSKIDQLNSNNNIKREDSHDSISKKSNNDSQEFEENYKIKEACLI